MFYDSGFLRLQVYNHAPPPPYTRRVLLYFVKQSNSFEFNSSSSRTHAGPVAAGLKKKNQTPILHATAYGHAEAIVRLEFSGRFGFRPFRRVPRGDVGRERATLRLLTKLLFAFDMTLSSVRYSSPERTFIIGGCVFIRFSVGPGLFCYYYL